VSLHKHRINNSAAPPPPPVIGGRLHATSSRVILSHSGAARGEGKGKLPPYGWTSKNYAICVCFHCRGTSSYHTTNTLQGRRAKSHVDIHRQYNRDWGTSYSRPPIDPYLTSPLLQNPGGATALASRGLVAAKDTPPPPPSPGSRRFFSVRGFAIQHTSGP